MAELTAAPINNPVLLALTIISPSTLTVPALALANSAEPISALVTLVILVTAADAPKPTEPPSEIPPAKIIISTRLSAVTFNSTFASELLSLAAIISAPD